MLKPTEYFRHEPTQCPWCNHRVDAATAIEDGPKPKPGDLTICVACGEWSAFAEGLALRKPSQEEFTYIGEDPDCRKVRAAWVAMKLKHSTKH